MSVHIDLTQPAIDFSTFPSSDGLPMADTEINLEQMIDLILQLRQPLEPLGHHVGGNLLIYYDPSDGLKHLAPDVFVALGSGRAYRESWKTWEEGKFPDVVFEVASTSTKNRDIGDKVRDYGELGAREYYIFDPARQLNPFFRGYQALDGRLEPLANPSGLTIFSPLLGLELRVMDRWLRVINPRSGEPFPLPAEALARVAREVQARQIAEVRAAREVRARRAAEVRAEREALARRDAEARAERDTAALREAQAEVARLRALLDQPDTG